MTLRSVPLAHADGGIRMRASLAAPATSHAALAFRALRGVAVVAVVSSIVRFSLSRPVAHLASGAAGREPRRPARDLCRRPGRATPLDHPNDGASWRALAAVFLILFASRLVRAACGASH